MRVLTRTPHTTFRSERLVVSIALAVPQLQELTLDRITRPQIHAPDLFGVPIPTDIGDGDIEDHPVVGSAWSIPSLLQIPTLQQLRIRDTHLGDRRWENATCLAPLSVLNLGSCCHVSPDVGRAHVEVIVRNVAKASPVNRLAIATGLEQTEFHIRPPLSRACVIWNSLPSPPSMVSSTLYQPSPVLQPKQLLLSASTTTSRISVTRYLFPAVVHHALATEAFSCILPAHPATFSPLAPSQFTKPTQSETVVTLVEICYSGLQTTGSPRSVA